MAEEGQQAAASSQETQKPVIQQPAKKSLLHFCLGWAHPNYPLETTLADADWRSQHDEISKNIWNLAWLLIASCLFCLITLGAPDAVLVNQDAKISIPFAGTTVSYSGFLFFGPLILFVLAMYLHVFVEQRLRIGRFKDRPLSPFLFNLGRPAADLLSAFVFYWMLPCVLIFFCWRALPRPEAPLLIFMTTAVTTFMVVLGIRRSGAPGPRTIRKRLVLGGLWLILVICVLLLFPLAHLAARMVFVSQTSGQGGQTVVAAGVRSSSILQPTRRLELFGAPLAKTNLSGLNAPYADMRKADLKEADLEGADLSNADLRKADLSKANLTGANLTGAHLEGAILTDATLRMADLHDAAVDTFTDIDVKWMRVLCIVNHNAGSDCSTTPNWAWTDLRDANLRESDLAGTDMTGADLQGSDLSKAKLSGAVLRLADLRRATLPPSIKDAVIDGALGIPEQLSKTAGKDVVMVLVNRATGACVQAPVLPENLSHVSVSRAPCSLNKPARRDEWNVQRYEGGYLQFMSLVPQKNGKAACLDGSFGTRDGTPIQMYECSPTKDVYDNQQWRIKVVEGYAQISKGNTRTAKGSTGACLDSGGVLGGEVHLWQCIDDSHNQDWSLTAVKAQR